MLLTSTRRAGGLGIPQVGSGCHSRSGPASPVRIAWLAPAGGLATCLPGELAEGELRVVAESGRQGFPNGRRFNDAAPAAAVRRCIVAAVQAVNVRDSGLSSRGPRESSIARRPRSTSDARSFGRISRRTVSHVSQGAGMPTMSRIGASFGRCALRRPRASPSSRRVPRAAAADHPPKRAGSSPRLPSSHSPRVRVPCPSAVGEGATCMEVAQIERRLDVAGPDGAIEQRPGTLLIAGGDLPVEQQRGQQNLSPQIA